tara:strand:+ start:160 stop:351 length:192 start_codon:yes stop_codon:yes gene_type:complete
MIEKIRYKRGLNIISATKSKTIEKKNNLDNWFADHVEILGGTEEVRKTVEKKIKDGLINGVKK